jgi:DNA replication protein DnaC
MIADTTDLDALFKRLHLANARRVWRDLVERAEREAWAYRDFLTLLATEEIAHRQQTRLARLTRRAHFPFLKTIDDFNFTYQSSLRLHMLGSALAADFVTEGRSLILAGKPGRGKTHLAIAIAYRAIQNGFDAFFTTAAALIDDLSAAFRAGELANALPTYTHPAVLVVDEVGYLTYGTDAANMLFHVVNERHRRHRPMVFTTNKSLKAWGRVLHDEDLAHAIIDRVLERGRLLRLDGPSVRTLHVNLDDAMKEDSDQNADLVRISGKSRSEFPEPTRARSSASRRAVSSLGSERMMRKEWRHAPSDRPCILHLQKMINVLHHVRLGVRKPGPDELHAFFVERKAPAAAHAEDRLGYLLRHVGVEFPARESRHLDFEERPDVCFRLFRTVGDGASHIFTPLRSSHDSQEGIHGASPVARLVALDRGRHGFDQLLSARSTQKRQLQQHQRMHEVRRIHGELKSNEGAVRVSGDVCSWDTELPQQCCGIGGLTFDAEWSVVCRAPGEPATPEADQAVVRQRGLSHERQERVSYEAAVDEQHRLTLTTDLVLDFPFMHGSTLHLGHLETS